MITLVAEAVTAVYVLVTKKVPVSAEEKGQPMAFTAGGGSEKKEL